MAFYEGHDGLLKTSEKKKKLMRLIAHQGPTRRGERQRTHPPPSLAFDSMTLYAIKASQALVGPPFTHLSLSHLTGSYLSLVPCLSPAFSLSLSL